MKVTLLRSNVAVAAGHERQYLTSFLFNDHLVIDAGSVGFAGTPQQQSGIRHVLISHTHIDHIASLPIFVENVYEAKRDGVTVHGSASVLECLRTDIFNDRVWPDFLRLSSPAAPFLTLSELHPGKTFELEGLRITPVPVNHVVPTLGFVVEDAQATVIIVSDTGPTDEIWRHANQSRNLKAVFLEVTFPNFMEQIAEVSRHLTPRSLAAELEKLHVPAAVITVHLKARFHEQVLAEVAALNLPRVRPVEFGKVYDFSELGVACG